MIWLKNQRFPRNNETFSNGKWKHFKSIFPHKFVNLKRNAANSLGKIRKERPYITCNASYVRAVKRGNATTRKCSRKFFSELWTYIVSTVSNYARPSTWHPWLFYYSRHIEGNGKEHLTCIVSGSRLLFQENSDLRTHVLCFGVWILSARRNCQR